MSDGAAWMHGKIMPIKEASLPLNDWGLTRSDITYDVVPVINGAFFRLNDYLNRFEASMKDFKDKGHNRSIKNNTLLIRKYQRRLFLLNF